MSEYVEIKGKTLDEAIINAILQLETTSDHLDYEVIDKGSSGFLGIGSKPVVIRARKKDEEEIEAEQRQKNAEIAKAEQEQKKQEQKLQEQKKQEQKQQEQKKQEQKQQEQKQQAQKKPEQKKPEQRQPEQKKQESGSTGHIKPAKENAETKNTEAPAPAPAKEIVPVDVTPMLGKAETFLTDVFKAMKLDVSIDVAASAEVNTIEVNLKGDDMGVLIGKRGQTLDSLQYLTSIIVNTDQDEYIRVKVDTENYRERRKETLENLARNIASKVKRSRKPVTLEPMNPYERRIIHSALQKDKYVETHSEGEEPYRKVVVTPNKNCRPPYSGGSGNGHRPYGGKPYHRDRQNRPGHSDHKEHTN